MERKPQQGLFLRWRAEIVHTEGMASIAGEVLARRRRTKSPPMLLFGIALRLDGLPKRLPEQIDVWRRSCAKAERRQMTAATKET